MTRLTLLAVALVPALVSASAPPPSVPREARRIVPATNAVGLDLYGRLGRQEGNLFLSPLSITQTLGMINAGASGKTLKDMNKGLRLPEPDKLHPGMGALLNSLQQSDEAKKTGVQLLTAAGVWGQQGQTFKKDFITRLNRDYLAEVGEMDFRKNPGSSRKAINSWVKKQTRNKIEDLFKKGDISDTTRVVLASAIYFQATWASPFDEEKTTEGKFNLTANKSVKAKLMRQVGQFAYARFKGLQALELPYKGNRLSMVVLLPEGHTLGAFEAKLTAKNIDSWTAALEKKRVAVTLPRFTIQSDLDLERPLSAMGLADAFGDGADFSAMNGEKNLQLSSVVHKAVIEVNERGTIAAAATGSGVVAKSVPLRFKADRPFVFLIRDRKSGSILFLGRLLDPTAS